MKQSPRTKACRSFGGHEKLIALLIVIPSVVLSDEQWQLYRNDKYNYEIQYPALCQVVITGPEKERDGRTVQIGLKNTARMHGVDIAIHPGMSLDRLVSQFGGPELSKLESGPVMATAKLHRVTWRKIRINGMPAVKMEARFTEDAEPFMTSILMNRLVFTAHPWRDAGFDEKTIERMISTFKWSNGSQVESNRGDANQSADPQWRSSGARSFRIDRLLRVR